MPDTVENGDGGTAAPNAEMTLKAECAPAVHATTASNAQTSAGNHGTVAPPSRNSLVNNATTAPNTKSASADPTKTTQNIRNVTGAIGSSTSSNRKPSRPSPKTMSSRNPTGGKPYGTSSLTRTNHSVTNTAATTSRRASGSNFPQARSLTSSTTNNQRSSRTSVASNGVKRTVATAPGQAASSRKLTNGNSTAFREQNGQDSGVKRTISGSEKHIPIGAQGFGRGRGVTGLVGPIGAVGGTDIAKRPMTFNQGSQGYLPDERTPRYGLGRGICSSRETPAERRASVFGRPGAGPGAAARRNKPTPQRANSTVSTTTPPGFSFTSRGNSTTSSGDCSLLQDTVSIQDQACVTDNQRDEEDSSSQPAQSWDESSRPRTLESSMSNHEDRSPVSNRLPGRSTPPVTRQARPVSFSSYIRSRPGSATGHSSSIGLTRRSPSPLMHSSSAIPRPVSRLLQRMQESQLAEWPLPNRRSSNSGLPSLHSSVGVSAGRRPLSGSRPSSASSQFSVQLPSVLTSVQTETSASRIQRPSGRSSPLETLRSSLRPGPQVRATTPPQVHSVMSYLPPHPTSGRQLSQQHSLERPASPGTQPSGSQLAESSTRSEGVPSEGTQTIRQLSSRPLSAQRTQQPLSRSGGSMPVDLPGPTSPRPSTQSLSRIYNGLSADQSSLVQTQSEQQPHGNTGTVTQGEQPRPPSGEETLPSRSYNRRSRVFAFRSVSNPSVALAERADDMESRQSDAQHFSAVLRVGTMVSSAQFIQISANLLN